MRSAVAILCGLLATASAAEVRFLAWDEEIATRELAVLADAGTKPVARLHPLQRTDAIEVAPANGVIRLRALDRKIAGGKPLDFPVTLEAGMTHPLVLLLPDPKAPSGLRGLAIEDSATVFPWGTFRLLNATGKSLACAIGKDKRMLPAGWKPIDVPAAGDSPLPVWFALPVEPVKPLYTAVWKPDENLRRLVILAPGNDPRLGPLAVKVILEDRRGLPLAAP